MILCKMLLITHYLNKACFAHNLPTFYKGKVKDIHMRLLECHVHTSWVVLYGTLAVMGE